MRYRESNWIKNIIITLVSVAVMGLVPLGANFWVYQEIQKRLKTRVSGQFVPSLVTPSFELRRGNFTWKDKVQLIQGDLKVTFDPVSIFSSRGFRIVVGSKNCEIKFLGDWALQEGIVAAVVDSLDADILLGRSGLSGINSIDVKSQSFQFSLKNVDKKVEK